LSCIKLTDITLGNAVTEIAEEAFKNCSVLTTVSIPEGVTVLENHLFDLCSKLKTVTLPSTLTTINEYAFYKCTQLKNLDIPDSVTHIGVQAFDGCLQMRKAEGGIVYVGNWMIRYNSASVIRDGTIGIASGSDTLSSSSITIPVSLRFVSDDVYCYFEIITYKGTAEQWASILLGENSEISYEEIHFQET